MRTRRASIVVVAIAEIVALLGAALLGVAVASAQSTGCESEPENLGNPGACDWIGISSYTAAFVAVLGTGMAVFAIARQRWLGVVLAMVAWFVAVGAAVAIAIIGDARY